MSTKQMNIYEGLFLLPHSATGNLQAAADHVLELLGRVDAEVLSFCKWDERRLAYEIRGNKRGVYFRSFFKAPGTRLAELERVCNLSEQILRAMILRADHVTPEQIEAADGRDKLADEIKLRADEHKADESEQAASEGEAARSSSATAVADPPDDKDEADD